MLPRLSRNTNFFCVLEGQEAWRIRTQLSRRFDPNLECLCTDSPLLLPDPFPAFPFLACHCLSRVPLGTVEEWRISNRRTDGQAAFVNHPFHLHVNHFQVTSVSHGAGVDYEVRHRKGQRWRRRA